jgi:hypothetical protein
MNATMLLENDHKAVEDLFTRFEKAEPRVVAPSPSAPALAR